MKRAQRHPPHTRGAFHRRPKPLYTEKTHCFVLQLPPQNKPHATFMQPLHCVLQHHVANTHLSTHMTTKRDTNHAAITLWSATTFLSHHFPQSPSFVITLRHHFPPSSPLVPYFHHPSFPTINFMIFYVIIVMRCSVTTSPTFVTCIVVLCIVVWCIFTTSPPFVRCIAAWYIVMWCKVTWIKNHP